MFWILATISDFMLKIAQNWGFLCLAIPIKYVISMKFAQHIHIMVIKEMYKNHYVFHAQNLPKLMFFCLTSSDIKLALWTLHTIFIWWLQKNIWKNSFMFWILATILDFNLQIAQIYKFKIYVFQHSSASKIVKDRWTNPW